MVLLSGGLLKIQAESEASQLAANWLADDEDATKHVEDLLTNAKLTMADVAAQSLPIQVVELDRLDHPNEIRENRRDKILQQIERRRTGWARTVKRASEDIIDGHIQETSPSALPKPANGDSFPASS